MKTNHANWDYHNTRVEMAEKEAYFLKEGAAAFLEKYAAEPKKGGLPFLLWFRQVW